MSIPLRRVPLALRLRLPSRSIPASFSENLSYGYLRTYPRATQWASYTPAIRHLHSSPAATRIPEAAVAASEDDVSQADSGSISKFSELGARGLVHRTVINTINNQFKFDNMTEVQSRTIPEGLTGVDVLAQAKTGTGKTMAFLLPIIQRILQADPGLARSAYGRFKPEDLKAIIISPTRELAEQIAAEARRLCRDIGIQVQTGVGGTQKSRHLYQLHREGCHILVGTPGRLQDLLSDPRSGVEAPNLTTFVLDEADRLLDQGFSAEIEQIQNLLPNRGEVDRQTLMYSATVSKDIVRLARSIMKPNLHYVRTVQEDEIPTHELVDQKVVLLPRFEHLLPSLLELCERGISQSMDPVTGENNFKAIVYFNTTAESTAAGEIFDNIAVGARSRNPELSQSLGLRKTTVLYMNSRLSQAERTRNSDVFRRAKSAILMSSDVTARGMDFPNVTHVIQIGVPRDRESYIHRLGRTARAGKSGQGWLLVPQLVAPTLNSQLRDMPLKSDDSLDAPMASFEEGPNDMIDLSDPAKKYYAILQDGARGCNKKVLSEAYQSLLASSVGSARSKQAVVDEINRMASVNFGMPEPPFISERWATNSGLARLRGIRIGQDPDFGRDDEFDNRLGGRYQQNNRSNNRDFGRRDGGDFRGSRSNRFGDENSFRGGNSRYGSAPRRY